MGDYCVPTSYSCLEPNGSANAWVYNDSPYTPDAICTYAPILVWAPYKLGQVRAKVGWSNTAQVCGCLNSNSRPAANLVPDLSTGYCYGPLYLTYNITSTRYTPSIANTPQVLTVAARRSDGSAADNTPITLRVTTADGTPGTVTPTSGVTDVNGELTASYTFPQFSDKKTDTIEIGCDTCSVATLLVDIKMSPTVIGFFNGVWNTEEAAQKSLDRLKREFGSSYQANNTHYQGASLKYDWFYNQSCTQSAPGTKFCIEDVVETFAQRSQELGGVLDNRWEYFWEMLSGTHTKSTSLTGTLLGWLGGVGSALANLIDATFNAMVNKFVALLGSSVSNPPTAADVATHLAKLQSYTDDDYTLLLVAHSQGNLFVNKAYDGLMASKPGAIAKVVHVAPASPTVHGKYVLADIDAVINSLRLSGIFSVQATNINLPISKVDPSGHTFEGTYLDAARAAYGRVKFLIADALESL